MIIGACGYGATGSSVITDLLREYDDIQVFDEFEFWLTYRVDGLEDLEYHLMKQYSKNISGDYAIKRFLNMADCYFTPLIHKPCSGKVFKKLTTDFISKITQTNYSGVETVDVLGGNVLKNILALASKKIILPKIVEKITGRPTYMWPCRKLYFSVKPENFYIEAKIYVENILKAMGADLSKPICLDQPFEGNAPEQSFPFFNNPYAIVVDRDPRDLYLAGKYSKDPNFKFIPRNDVEKFIVFYKHMRQPFRKHQCVLRINFEDLVYNYEKSVQSIEKFLHLGKHVRKQAIFNPRKSINNTQLIRLHPEDEKEIDRIESELKEFLFPFEKYSNVKFDGNPFDGAARKAFEQ